MVRRASQIRARTCPNSGPPAANGAPESAGERPSRRARESRRGRSQVWSTRPGGVTRLLVGDAAAIRQATISRDGRTLATGSENGTVRLWDIPSQQALGALLPVRHNRMVLPFFTPDGSRLITSYDTGDAYIWDIRPQSLGALSGAGFEVAPEGVDARVPEVGHFLEGLVRLLLHELEPGAGDQFGDGAA
jgi:WD40 repeat protein